MVGRRSGRGWRVAALAGLALVGALGWTGGPAGADPTPTLTVTPTTDLLDRHPLRVTGSGFTPGEHYAIVDCAADACVVDEAYWLTMGDQQAPVTPLYDPRRRETAAADGTISTSVRANRVINVGELGADPVLVDCSAEPCTLAVVSLDDDSGERLAEVPLDIEPTGTYTWAPGTLQVEAPARLPDQGTIEISGTGWDPGAYETAWWGEKLWGVKAEICATGPGSPAPPATRCQLLAYPYPVVDHDGAVSAEVTVDRFVDVGPGWDCRVKACTVRIGQGTRYSPEVPIAFGPEWSPFTSAADMVDRLARRFTGGPLPSAQRTPLVTGLAGGTRTGADVLRFFVERQGAPSEVATLYVSILQRRPDTDGLLFWVARRRSGLTAARIAEQFANTPEVRAWHQDLSNSAAVGQVYQRVLGRPADQAGLAYWVGRLEGGLSRPKLIASFALSPESRARTRSEGAWTTLTYGAYRRAPDATEWARASDVDEMPVQEDDLRTALGSDALRAVAEAPVAVLADAT